LASGNFVNRSSREFRLQGYEWRAIASRAFLFVEAKLLRRKEVQSDKVIRQRQAAGSGHSVHVIALLLCGPERYRSVFYKDTLQITTRHISQCSRQSVAWLVFLHRAPFSGFPDLPLRSMLLRFSVGRPILS
jgi:hypothetical protein